MSKIAEMLAKSTVSEGKGLAGSESALPVLEEEDELDMGVGDEEVSAMRMFEKAKTTEQKAEALKAFIKACGY